MIKMCDALVLRGAELECSSSSSSRAHGMESAVSVSMVNSEDTGTPRKMPSCMSTAESVAFDWAPPKILEGPEQPPRASPARPTSSMPRLVSPGPGRFAEACGFQGSACSLEEAGPSRTRFASLFEGTMTKMQFLQATPSRRSEELGWLRQALAKVLLHPLSEAFIALVGLGTMCLLIADADARADLPGRSPLHEAPVWIARGIDISYALCVLEMALRMYVERGEFLGQVFNRIDVFVVSVGLGEYVLLSLGSQVSLGMFGAIRLCRMLRLLRFVRLFAAMRELSKQMMMMASCFKTVFWS